MEALWIILLALIGIVVKAKMRTPTSTPPPRSSPSGPNRPVIYRTLHTAAASTPSNTAAPRTQPAKAIASRLQPAMTSRVQSASYAPVDEDCEEHVAYPEATVREANLADLYEATPPSENGDPYGVFSLDEDDAQRAFVLREVLDAPVSMRGRRSRP